MSDRKPRDSLKEAFRAGWLHDEAAWLDVLDHRNMTSHASLAQDSVEKTYAEIAALTPMIRSTVQFLKARYAPPP